MKSPALLKLHEARWWLRGNAAIHAGFWTLAVGIALLAVGNLFSIESRRFLPATTAVALSAALAWALWRWSDLREVAAKLDIAARTKDRFVSWLHFQDSDGMEKLARDEVEAFATSLKIPPTLKPHWPLRPLILLAVSVVILGAGWSLKWVNGRSLAPERARATALLEEAKAAAKNSSLDPKKAAELQRTFQDALQKLAASPDPKRDALRTISEAEKSLAGGVPFSPEESAALAQASQALDPALAQALAAGPSEQAAEALSALSAEAIRQIVEQAAQHQAGERLRQLARQASGEQQQQMVQAYTRQSGRQSQLSDDLQNMLVAGARNPDSSQGTSDDSPPGQEPASGTPKDNAPPGGGRGTDHDEGKGSDLQTAKAHDLPESATESLATGTKSDGPSTVQLGFTGGNDQAKAATGTTGTFQAAEAAALDAVARENVPIGSRILVRRYFESLRNGQ